MKSFIFLVIAFLGFAQTAKVSYEGYKVYRITPLTEEHLKNLKELEKSNVGISFWEETDRIGKSADVMFPPHLQGDIIEGLEKQGFGLTEYISNVQKLINAEGEEENPNVRFSFTAYHRYPAVEAFLKEQAEAPNHPHARLASFGKTYEGRELTGIVIAKQPNKPVIFVEAGIHAREWIAGAVANFLVDQLLNNVDDPIIQQWTEDYEWHILPIANPDGFQYTHTHDRLWRKTRSIIPGTTCRGADPNRNWSFKWGTGGSSSQPCDITFMGTAPFSEIETKTLSEYITNLSDRLVFYLDIHSYSQLILFPFGVDHPLPDKEKQLEIGRRAAEALIVRYKTNFTVGTIFDDLYLMSGGSHDWVKETYKTPLVLAYELRDQGQYGFLLPASQIIESGLEFMDSLKSLIVDLDGLLNP